MPGNSTAAAPGGSSIHPDRKGLSAGIGRRRCLVINLTLMRNVLALACVVVLAGLGCCQVEAAQPAGTTLTVNDVLAAFSHNGIQLRRLPGQSSGLTALQLVDDQSELTVGVYRSVSTATQSESKLRGSWPREGATGRRILNVIVVRRLIHAKRPQPFPSNVRAALSRL